MPPGVYQHKSKDPIDRFLSKVDRSNVEGCWLWTAYRNPCGYGEMYFKGRARRASQVSYMLFVEEIPRGMGVLHRCDNPACVNPKHLFIGTQQDNLLDMKLKGRNAKGERIKSSKLTASDIICICSSTDTHKKLAARFGVRKDHIGRIKRRIRWAHVNIAAEEA